MEAKLVSVDFAKKWYDLGVKYAHLWSQPAVMWETLEKDNIIIDCWEKWAAFKAGAKGLPFEIKRWRRYGEIPIGADGYAAPSVNHADNESEAGVSVATREWEKSLRGLLSVNSRSRKLVRFWGLRVGTGSDGEPVVLPVRK